ncbi:HCL194Cp [Eremothecium sinecaudum]|uniref:HCL194Cp n=1 Tax=Eremothecium sinecaudum TaxID=45286 RepID=A0A0X8HR75_9SACH|nr:HCL194Cp [Eremothecium sinecaudum]AMD19957.1 HCL194Cp [Eremothecium sinecaudum]
MKLSSSEKLVAPIAGFFTLVAIILVIIATAGLTTTREPMVNVYMGNADITGLQVTKVIRRIENVYHFVADVVQSGRLSESEVRDELGTIGGSSQLGSVLDILTNNTNYHGTLVALADLAAAVPDANEASASRLKDLHQLLDLATDKARFLKAMGSLLSNPAPATNETARAQALLRGLLFDSTNPVDTLGNMATLSNYTMVQKADILAFVVLFTNSNNITATTYDLETLLNTNVSTAFVRNLTSRLPPSGDIIGGLTQLAGTLQGQELTFVRTIADILRLSKDPMTDLSMLNSTATDSNAIASAKANFPPLAGVLKNSRNTTFAFESVQELSVISDDGSAGRLFNLYEIVSTSREPTEALVIISSLQENPMDEAGKKSLPALFALLSYATDPIETFNGLLSLNSLAGSSPDTFSTVVGLLNTALAYDGPQEFERQRQVEVLPAALRIFDVPANFRLGIFSLCGFRYDGDLKSCTPNHAVQDFDYGHILYDFLLESRLRQYLEAMSITEQEFFLEGRLLNHQNLYVPAVRGILAFNIIGIVLGLVIILSLILSLLFSGSRLALFARFLSILVTIAFFAAALIDIIVISIIKSGTAYDDYGVVYSTGSAFAGLVWSAFILTFLSAFLLWTTHIKAKKAAAKDTQSTPDGFAYSEKQKELGDEQRPIV